MGYNNPFLVSRLRKHLIKCTVHNILWRVRLLDSHLAMDFNDIYTVKQGLSVAQNPQKWANLDPLRFVICLSMFWFDIFRQSHNLSHTGWTDQSTLYHGYVLVVLQTIQELWAPVDLFFTLISWYQCQCDAPYSLWIENSTQWQPKCYSRGFKMWKGKGNVALATTICYTEFMVTQQSL